MHGIVVVVVVTHTPVASGLPCWQTRPAAQTGGGAKRLPPHGPPMPEKHLHVVAPGRLSQLAPGGQLPPQAPKESLPHGRTQRAPGAGQHVSAPSGLTQMQTWTHIPFRQASCVQPFPSWQSASVWHVFSGSVVVVLVDGTGQAMVGGCDRQRRTKVLGVFPSAVESLMSSRCPTATLTR